MTEWTVIQVLIATIGLGITVGVPLAKLVATMTRLDITIREMQKDIYEHRERNTETHARIFERIEVGEGKINEHEAKINKLEGKTI